LKVCAFNLENLFLLPTSPENKTYTKSEEKVKKIAAAILDIDADIFALSEVGGLDSLHLLNQTYLGGKYYISLIKGNSDRGIELAYLISKKTSYTFEQYTYKNVPLDFKYPHEKMKGEEATHYLSRDVAELRLKDKNGETKLITLLVHLKSAYDPEGIDFLGKLRREAELQLLLKIYNKLEMKFPNTPIILLGDFNGNASKEHHSSEFESIYKHTELIDLLDLKNLPKEQKTTFCSFSRSGQSFYEQLDYIFMPKKWSSLVNQQRSGIYRYKDENGLPFAIPQSNSQKYALPSDHYPIMADLNLQ
jgi:endonuclease/exonuclease/phosphatase family metal-dependent hydrolase